MITSNTVLHDCHKRTALVKRENVFLQMSKVTFDTILADGDSPAVAIDHHGLFFYVNASFTRTYGWNADDLIGRVITTIIPPHMRDAHNFGFSRFLATESPRILQTSLTLPVCCKDGSIIDAEHYIISSKTDGAWRFAATILPVHGAK